MHRAPRKHLHSMDGARFPALGVLEDVVLCAAGHCQPSQIAISFPVHGALTDQVQLTND